MKKKFLGLLAAALCIFALPSCDDNDNDIKYNDVPNNIMNTFQQTYPNAGKVEWEKKGKYYVADFINDSIDMDVWFNPGDGSIAMSEYDYGRNLMYLPPEVDKAFADGEYGYWTVDDVKYYDRTALNSFYLIEVEKAGQRDKELYYGSDGKLIKAIDESNRDITPDTQL